MTQQTQPASAAVLEGIVNRFFIEKHFGFIWSPALAGEIFFHELDVKTGEALLRGTRVCFNVGEYKNRPVAVNVTPPAPVPAPMTDGDGGAK